MTTASRARFVPRRLRAMAVEAIKLVVGGAILVVVVEFLRVRYGFPGTVEVFSATRRGLYDGWLAHDAAVTSARWLLGFFIGTPLGLALGLLTGRSRAASLAFEGFMVWARTVPYVGLVPVMVRLWGFDETGKVVLVAWASVGLAWVLAHRAAIGLPPDVVWRCRTLGIRKTFYVRRVLLPQCFAELASATRATLSLSLLVTAVTELGGVVERQPGTRLFWTEGLGYRLFRALDEGRDDRLFAAIFTFSLIGILSDRLCVLLTAGWAAGSRAVAMRSARRRLQKVPNANSPTVRGNRRAPSSFAVQNLSAAYGDRTITSDFSLDLSPGETCAWLARSGQGKSTSLIAMARLGPASMVSSGTVLVDGTVVRSAGTWCGLVLQHAPVFPHLTVLDHVAVGHALRRMRRRRRDASAMAILREFDLIPRAADMAGTLSGGERQRLAFATALANEPKVLFADEPWVALDAITKLAIRRLYRDNVYGNVTTILVSHDVFDAALLADKAIVGVGAGREMVHLGPPPQSAIDSTAAVSNEVSDRVRILSSALEQHGQKATA